MQIKQIDILVHPDYFQMSVPHLPFHERQMILRKLWEQRIDTLEKQRDTILLHFSNMTTDSIEQGLKDISTITNRIERDEIERINKSIAKLGSRFIWFGWFVIPSSELLEEIFKSRELTYIPDKTKIRGYGEIFEVCTSAWIHKTALSLGIPSSNVEYCREESLTNADCNVINKWRVNKLINQYNNGFAQHL
ncbi:hypothetical protein A2363_02810 [Candidatus Gottesmanbacteria bacterium RIFOXYB1_FULL_47_11]|uniref:Uncharacterized protein n=1 Tax=Candidatus Gottesmanbacteria bacterium RIFOXYB1_FULL_47_11 TaxID=1798401 RepID=A0A1F6BEL3_9BACT|nr:MAG: hypothetical protein A2363_02810 [Candidatus Gottesmanbacteria bacterium RIFOXYB1_FULL_47_11]